ncbi:MAG: FAD-dependent oxidoreductase [Myxococcota bacterium]
MERFLLAPEAPGLSGERDRLLARLAALVPDAEVLEVGSTAIPGCIGKGDLDVLVRAPAARFEAVRAALDAVFPRNPHQLSNAEYQGYTVPSELDVAIQCTVKGGPYDDFEPFLVALRGDPGLVRDYDALKRQWNGQPMDAYRAAKSAFIRGVLDGPEAVPESCEVAIVGASLAGVALALYLARAGVDVVLLEARRTVGNSVSGLGTGPVEHGVVEQPHRTIRALGERVADLHAFTARNRELLADEGLFERCGVVWVATQDGERAEIAESVAALAGCGIPGEAWSPEQVAAWAGRPLGPALFLPDDGRLDPGPALHTLLGRAREAGARVVLGVPCTVRDGEPLVVEARGTPLTAEVVVFTAGIGCAGLDARLGASLTPVRDQALLTAPTEVPPALGFGRAGQGWTTWRPHPSGGLVVSGARWATPHMELGESDPTVVEPRIQARLEGFLRDSLRCEAPIVDRWAWVFASTRDGLPLLGPLPGQPRRIACVGFGANPASFALAAARSVADGLLDGGGEVPWMLSSRRLVRWTHG